ncbi:hypothetical protein [Phyllobacterium endophyticum]|uniref:Uncharacterized protein n=1 Tax=Phyllobacterium endophyticum TaxID=1149773 RepID=A0A2P7AV38_9HYPH|nr:hypothetical protein [Phyllobacterium endophyticum]MBB3234539.1 hypothetical protein [Phyllobacterium endophyticum]PSH58023.1 hypothetical protein CU100_10170 [Phyllobacterium endophyticum]TYR38691.1 hypothetical protein FY050_22130 [Phyllobacterium endophyticum]
MAELVNTAPRFDVILSSEVRPANKSVAVLMGTGDKKRFGLEFAASVVPALITVLTGMMGKLMPAIPEDERPNPQVLDTKSITLAMNDEGGVGLILSFEGDFSITLAMPTGDLPALRQMIDEAIGLTDKKAKH